MLQPEERQQLAQEIDSKRMANGLQPYDNSYYESLSDEQLQYLHKKEVGTSTQASYQAQSSQQAAGAQTQQARQQPPEEIKVKGDEEKNEEEKEEEDETKKKEGGFKWYYLLIPVLGIAVTFFMFFALSSGGMVGPAPTPTPTPTPNPAPVNNTSITPTPIIPPPPFVEREVNSSDDALQLVKESFSYFPGNVSDIEIIDSYEKYIVLVKIPGTPILYKSVDKNTSRITTTFAGEYTAPVGSEIEALDIIKYVIGEGTDISEDNGNWVGTVHDIELRINKDTGSLIIRRV